MVKPPVGFSTSKTGVRYKEVLAGNIGVGFKKPFRLLFDCPGQRFGLEKR